jgi:WD40 repeat protein/predicted ATPase
VASGGQDGTVKLWVAENGNLLATLQGHIGGVRGVAFSAESRLMATGSDDGTVRLWTVPDGHLLATMRGHAGPVWGIALSADGRLLASASLDGTVRLWSAERGNLLATLQGHSGGVRSVAFSADGHTVASGGDDGTVRLWDVANGHQVATLQGHTGGVWGVALSADGQMVASASLDGTVKLWEMGSGRPLATVRGYSSGVWGVALSGDGQVVAGGSLDRTARLWEVGSGQPLAILQGHSSGVRGVALSGDGHTLASAGMDGTVRLWTVPAGLLLATLQGHTGPVIAVALSADGHILASGSLDRTVRLWAAASGHLLATLEGHIGPVVGVALSADGHTVASASFDGTVRLWAMAPAGGTAPTGGYPVATRQLLATLEEHSGPILGVALSEDGRLLASGGDGMAVTLREVASGRVLATLQGHTGPVTTVALSADGHIVASGSVDGTARLWQAASGQPLAILQGHSSLVWGVALSGDGHLVASASRDATVKLWEASSGACLRTLRADRPYERLDITGLTGVTAAQRAALLALGAVDGETVPGTSSTPAQVSYSPATASAVVSAPRPEPAPRPMAAGSPVRPPTNLPPARTTFVGRTGDLATLARVLDPTTRSGTRLLTLSGVAGCGKSRLALAVAEAVLDAYQDGVWLVALAPLPASPAADPMAVAVAALTALGLHQQQGQDPLDTLVAHLRTRRPLLVLDNCEHVVTACAALATRLLAACPELQVLTTSQQALGCADETVWRVAPLAVPPQPTDALTAQEVQLLGQSDALQLFVERARSVRPGLALTTATAAQVVAICRQLDGLPLAIELAAARLGVLPLEEILVRLEDRFRLLRHGRHSPADRHQALQATMNWSYDLLDPAEQALLRRLAVFAGGWELAAAEVVCAGDVVPSEVVLELLDELLDRSLVYIADVEGVPRYGLLETVRLYGLQQLEHAGETAVVREQHLAWCMALAEQSVPALQGPDQGTWLDRLARDLDNLRSALQWALDRGLTVLGLRLAGALGKFWLRAGHQREGQGWLAAVLRLPEEDDSAAMAARATALDAAAWLASDAHDFTQAAALFAQSDALRRAVGQEDSTAASLINAAMEARAGGDYPRATALLEAYVAQQRALGSRVRGRQDDPERVHAIANRYTSLLALVLREQGAYSRASALCDECAARSRELGDAEGVAIALLSMADVARDLGDAGRVRAYGEESLARFRELGHQWAIGFSLNNLALAAYQEGTLGLAARYAEESVALFRGQQAEPSLAEVLVTLGRIRAAQGEAATARAHLAEALTLAWAKGPRFMVAAALDMLGVQVVRQGQARHGVSLLAATAALRRTMATPVRPADQATVEGALAEARVALSDTAFTAAWDAGETLPLEQVVALALAGAVEDRAAREPPSGT